MANTNFSPYRYIHVKQRPTRIQREYRIRGRASKKALSFLFPRRFVGNARFLRYVNPSIGFFKDALRNLWKISSFFDPIPDTIFLFAGFLLFYIYRFMLHCDSNEITDSFCSSSLIRTRLIFLLHFGNIFFPDFFLSFLANRFLATNFSFFFILARL